MRKQWMFVLMFFVLLLVSCDEIEDDDPILPVTYDYSYQLDMERLDTFVAFEYEHLPMATVDKRVKITFSLLEDSEASDVLIAFKIKKVVNIIEETISYDEHETTMNGSSDHIIEVTYSGLATLVDVFITDISGTINTNTFHEYIDEPIDDDGGVPLTMDQFKEAMLPVVSNHIRLTTKTTLVLSKDTITETTTMINVFDQEAFYYASVVFGFEGLIIEEVEGIYVMVGLSQFEGIDYFRLADVFETAPLQLSLDFGLDDFEPDWLYELQEDTYVVTALLTDMIHFLVEDEDLANEILQFFGSTTIEMRFDILGDHSISVKTTIVSGDQTVDITTLYDYGVAEHLDLVGYLKMPPQNPALIDELTNITSPLGSQVYNSGYPNYYAIMLEEGTYAIADQPLIDLVLYDENGNRVSLMPSPTYGLIDGFDHIYDIQGGIYILEVSSPYDMDFLYDLQFVPLHEIYDTLIDPLNPEVIEEDTYHLVIEGQDDLVLASFDAPEGGILKLTPQSPYDGLIYVSGHDGDFVTYYLAVTEEAIYIPLSPGENKVLFRAFDPTEVTFDVETYGSAPDQSATLLEVFPEDFVVATPDTEIKYQFDVPEAGVMTFAVELDVFMVLPTNGKSMQVYVYDEEKTSKELYISFSVIDQREIFLPEGSYELRVLGSMLTSMKIKGTWSSIDPETLVLIEPETVSDMSQYLMNSDAYMNAYRHYPGFEKTLRFTLDQKTFVFIDQLTDVNFYHLYDDFGNHLTFIYHTHDQVYCLDPGTYEIRFGVNEEKRIATKEIAVTYVIDPIVLEDDVSYDPNNVFEIALDEVYVFEKEYADDFEIVKVVIDQTTTLSINLSTSTFVSIYRTTDALVKQTYDTTSVTLDAGTYYIVVMYLSHRPVGTTVSFELGT